MEDNNKKNSESPHRNNQKEALRNAMLITELGIDLQQRCISSEKYISDLRTLFERGHKTVSRLQKIAKNSLEQAHKTVTNALNELKANGNLDMVPEYEKLLNLIEKHLSEYECRDIEIEHNWSPERNKFYDAKTRGDLPSSTSLKSVKSDIDEKYPENWSRESLIDLNNVVNLPPVPEDIFTSFSGKPTKSSSLSSLKSLRKVKLFLQKAESSDDEESSDLDEHYCNAKMVYGDNDENKSSGIHSPSKKLLLGNIKEEAQDQ